MKRESYETNFHSRIILDLGVDADDGTIWFVMRDQDGFTRLQDRYSDYSSPPVSERVYNEWLSAIEGAFGHFVLKAGRRQQQMGVVGEPGPALDVEAT